MTDNLAVIVQTVSILGGIVGLVVVGLRFSTNFTAAMTRIEAELRHLCDRMARMDDRNSEDHDVITANLNVVRGHVREHGLELSALEAKVAEVCKVNGPRANTR